MKNFEKYIDEIARVSCVKEIFEDYRYYCSCCEFSIEGDCDCNKVKQWYLQEYVEPIKLTHDEYVILKNLDKKFEYIARDEFSCLDVFEKKPYLDGDYWSSTGHEYSIGVYNHLFQFIKFEDEPYEIAKLIEDYEKEHENGNI